MSIATATLTPDSTNAVVPPMATEAAAWDAFVASHPCGHHEQSSLYGKVRHAYGYEIDRVVLRQAGEIAGGAQLMWRRTPIGRIGVVQRAPLALDDEPELLAQVVEELEGLAEALHLAVLRVETFAPQGTARTVMSAKGFVPRKYWGGEHLTSRIRLPGNDEEVLGRMTPKGRYNIRRAQRLGVEVRQGGREMLEEFYRLYALSAAHKGFVLFEPGYFEYLLDVFGATGRVALFTAYHENRPVAALFNMIVGEHMLYGWGGVDRSEEVRKLMAGYLLHYEAMKWARDRGCEYYDMLGISATSTAGLTRFKTRIAPERFRWPTAMWKYYGRLGSARAVAAEAAWSRPMLKKLVTGGARRLGLRPTMPW